MKKSHRTQNQTWLSRSSAHIQRAFSWLGSITIAGGQKKRLLRASGAPGSGGLDGVILPGARRRWLLPRLRTLTPEYLEGLLLEAGTGSSPVREQELYTLMEQTWPRLAKNLNELKNAVIGLDWTVRNPEGAANQAAEDLVSRARFAMRGDPAAGTLGWEGMLRALLDGWFRGVSLVEIQWQAGPGGILPRSARPIPAWHWGWPRGQDRLLLYREPGRAETAFEVPRDRVLVAVHNAGGEHPSTGALLRPLVWWWAAGNFSSEWLLNHTQLFGQPYRWATYDRGDAAAASQLLEILEQMGAAGYGVGPEGTDIKFIESAKSAADNPQAALLDRADRLCDILVLGQTLTTDVGDSGSRALGEVHSGVRADIIDAAASWLAEVLNEQLLPALFRLHTGREPDFAALPWWEAQRKQTRDTKLTAEVIEILTRAGLPVPKAWAYDVLDIPAPEPGEAVIEPPKPAAAADPAPFLAGLPTEARAYLLAKLGSRE